MCSGMYKASGIGRSEDQARERALAALKERLWRECWRDAVELDAEDVSVVEVDGVFEVEVKVKSFK